MYIILKAALSIIFAIVMLFDFTFTFTPYEESIYDPSMHVLDTICIL